MQSFLQFFNQHSYVIIAVLLWGLASGLALRMGRGWPALVLLALLAIALTALWLALRPTPTPLAQESAALEKVIGHGTPVLLEFQSPY